MFYQRSFGEDKLRATRVVIGTLGIVFFGVAIFFCWRRIGKSSEVLLGVLPNGSTYTGTYQIANNTDADLHIDKIVGGCRCIKSYPKNEVVPARSNAEIDFTWKIRGRHEEEIEQRQLVFFTEPAGNPKEIRFKATVSNNSPALTFIPAEVCVSKGDSIGLSVFIFGKHSIVSQIPDRIILDGDTAPIIKVDCTIKGSQMARKAIGIEFAPGSIDLQKGGNFSTNVAIHSEDDRLVIAQLPVKVVAESQIDITPKSLVFFRGDEQWKRVLLRCSNGEFSVESVSHSGVLEWNTKVHDHCIELNLLIDGSIAKQKGRMESIQVSTSIGVTHIDVL